MSNKYLVTGAAGFIGYYLSKRLLEKGIEVVAVDKTLGIFLGLMRHIGLVLGIATKPYFVQFHAPLLYLLAHAVGVYIEHTEAFELVGHDETFVRTTHTIELGTQIVVARNHNTLKSLLVAFILKNIQ